MTFEYHHLSRLCSILTGLYCVVDTWNTWIITANRIIHRSIADILSGHLCETVAANWDGLRNHLRLCRLFHAVCLQRYLFSSLIV